MSATARTRRERRCRRRGSRRELVLCHAGAGPPVRRCLPRHRRAPLAVLADDDLPEPPETDPEELDDQMIESTPASIHRAAVSGRQTWTSVPRVCPNRRRIHAGLPDCDRGPDRPSAGRPRGRRVLGVLRVVPGIVRRGGCRVARYRSLDVRTPPPEGTAEGVRLSVPVTDSSLKSPPSRTIRA